MAEFVYALFILSGLIKFFIRQKAPALDVVDFTLITAVLCATVLLWGIYRNVFLRSRFHIAPRSRGLLTFSALFYLWMIATLAYTPSPGYSYTKTFLFLTTLLGFLFPLLHEFFDPHRFVRHFLYVGAFFILLFIVFLKDIAITSALEADKEFMAKYLDIGLLAGLNLLLLIFFPTLLRPAVKIILAGVSMTAVITSGGRGPIVVLVIVFVIKIAVNAPHYWRILKRLTLKRLIALLAGLAILMGTMVYVADKYADSLERTVQRLALMGDAASASISKRLDYISFTIDKAADGAARFLFGYGVGGFGILFNREDGRDYPHNLILEVWFEMGALGVILIAALFFIAIRGLWGSSVFYIFLYLFINSMKSQSLTDLRVMFGITAVLWIFQHLPENASPGTEPIADE